MAMRSSLLTGYNGIPRYPRLGERSHTPRKKELEPGSPREQEWPIDAR